MASAGREVAELASRDGRGDRGAAIGSPFASSPSPTPRRGQGVASTRRRSWTSGALIREGRVATRDRWGAVVSSAASRRPSLTSGSGRMRTSVAGRKRVEVNRAPSARPFLLQLASEMMRPLPASVHERLDQIGQDEQHPLRLLRSGRDQFVERLAERGSKPCRVFRHQRSDELAELGIGGVHVRENFSTSARVVLEQPGRRARPARGRSPPLPTSSTQRSWSAW